MRADTHTSNPKRRGSAGLALLKPLVWIVIGFACYSGFSLRSVWSARTALTHVVQKTIEDTPHHLGDKVLAGRIVRNAKVARMTLDPGLVAVVSERPHGEHVVHIDIERSISIQFLGAERNFDVGMHTTEVVKIDEAAEAARLKREQKYADWQRGNVEKRDEQIREAREKCERKHGVGNCEIVLPPGTRGAFY